MIIVRSPLRISLGGGGTDLPSYYRKHSGFLIAAAINKYVYITIHETFVKELIIKYSKLERVEKLDDLQHPLLREALRLLDIRETNLEITSMADIPSGTGLGSSGSFTTALLKALHNYRKNLIHPRELAEQACQIEIDILKESVGKQDQYIAAYGGLTCFQFLPNDQVEATPLKLSTETLYNLEDNLLLFFTGYSRSASSILKDQDERSKGRDGAMLENLHFVKDLGWQSKEALDPLRTFKPGTKTLEIGAGIGAHLNFENLEEQEYVALELRQNVAAKLQANFPQILTVVGDCQEHIDFPDGYFDRVLAIHLLEHLPNLPKALAQIQRVLSPTGQFSVVIPCEGGIGYTLARNVSARPIFEKRYKQSYDWFVASEHVNLPNEIIQELLKRFVITHRSYFPFLIPVTTTNLVIGLTLKLRVA